MEEAALKGLIRLRDSQFNGNTAELARACNVNPNLITRWFRGDRKPSWKNLAPILESLGANIIFGHEASLQKEERYSATNFDVELKSYLNGLITIQRKNVLSVASIASCGNIQMQKRICDFLGGRGPLWASDIQPIASALSQTPDQIIKVVSEMAYSQDNTEGIQQTLAS